MIKTHRAILLLAGFVLSAMPQYGQEPANRNNNSERQTEALNPFDRMAWIPADANTASIKFVGIKETTVFTTIETISDPVRCNNLSAKPPLESEYCPEVRDGSPARAYEVTYSFIAAPLPTDKTHDPNFAFQVYFRPEELPPQLRKAVTEHKVKREELGSYFRISTSRPSVQSTVVNNAKSSFCKGTYVDGSWVLEDPNCQDKVVLKKVIVPSQYIAVKVELISRR
jgi:hypothetical protein